MLEVLRAIPHNSDKIRISREFRADLFWWKTFITQYNGVSVLGDTLFSEPGQIFQTDACLTHCGGLCGEECFSWPFPQFVLEQHIDINGLELLTIVVACKLWGQTWAGQRIIVQCDNEVQGFFCHSCWAEIRPLSQSKIASIFPNFIKKFPNVREEKIWRTELNVSVIYVWSVAMCCAIGKINIVLFPLRNSR